MSNFSLFIGVELFFTAIKNFSLFLLYTKLNLIRLVFLKKAMKNFQMSEYFWANQVRIKFIPPSNKFQRGTGDNL